ncbi:hypothetical protein [Actinophytocola sediminis]
MAALDEVPAARGLGECVALLRSAEALRLSAPELAVQLVRRALVISATDSADAEAADQARSLAMRARAILAGGLVRISHYVDAVEPALAALVLAESAGEDELATSVRLDLAACAREVGEPLLGCALLRPVVEAARSRPSVRAVALSRLVGCTAHIGRRDDVEDALAEADRLLGLDDGLNPDERRLARVRLSVRTAAYHRWYGDTEDAVDAAREGLGQLNRLRGSRPENARLRAQLVLELACALLDDGELGEAETIAQPLLDEPVRATSAAAVGQLMMAVATRIHLPSGRVERGRALLDQAVRIGDRHGLDGLLADARTAVAQLDEQAGFLGEALESFRGARSAEQRRLRATAKAARQLLVTVGVAQDWDASAATALLSKVTRQRASPVAAVSPIATPSPTVPATPTAPAQPAVPATPAAPAFPATFAAAAAPAVPATPAAHAAPVVPTAPALPAAPSVSAAHTAPIAPAVPAVPAVPATSAAPAVPATPAAAAAYGAPAVPAAHAAAAAGDALAVPAMPAAYPVPAVPPAPPAYAGPAVPTASAVPGPDVSAAHVVPPAAAALDAQAAHASAGPAETAGGLLDRDGLYRRLHAVRNGERPVALTLVRLAENGTRSGINLTDLAGLVRELAPDNAELARSDGTELAVILPRTTKDQAEQFARTIRDTALRADWLTQANAQSISTGVGQSSPDAPMVDVGALLTSARHALTPAEPPRRPGERTQPVLATARTAEALAQLHDTGDTLRIGRSIINSLSIPEGSGGKRRAETGTHPALPTESPRPAPAADGPEAVHGSSSDAPLPDHDATGVTPDPPRSVGETGGYRPLVTFPATPDPAPPPDDTVAGATSGSTYAETRAELARMMSALESGALPETLTEAPPPTSAETSPAPAPSGLSTSAGGRWSFAPVGETTATTPAEDHLRNGAALPSPPTQSIPTPPEPTEVPQPPPGPEVPEPDPPDPIPVPPAEPDPAPRTEPSPAPPPPAGRRERRGERTGDSSTLAGLLAEALVAYQETRDDDERLADGRTGHRDHTDGLTDVPGQQWSDQQTDGPAAAPAPASTDRQRPDHLAGESGQSGGEPTPGSWADRLAGPDPQPTDPRVDRPDRSRAERLGLGAHSTDRQESWAARLVGGPSSQSTDPQPGQLVGSWADRLAAADSSSTDLHADRPDRSRAERLGLDSASADSPSSRPDRSRAERLGLDSPSTDSPSSRPDRSPAERLGPDSVSADSLSARPEESWLERMVVGLDAQSVERAAGASGQHRPDRPIGTPDRSWDDRPGADESVPPPDTEQPGTTPNEGFGSFDRLFDWRYQSESGRHRSPE